MNRTLLITAAATATAFLVGAQWSNGLHEDETADAIDQHDVSDNPPSRVDPLDRARVQELEQVVESVRGRQQALEQRVNATLEESPSNSGEVVEVDLVEYQREELENRLQQHAYDQAASSEAVSEMTRALTGELASVSLDGASCVTSVCSLDFQLPPVEGAADHAVMVNALYSLEYFSQGGGGVVSFPNEGTGDVTRVRILAMRAGHTLPAP